LYSVTRNKIIDSYRKKKTESLEDFVYQDEDGELNVKDILLADDIVRTCFQRNVLNELMKALDELPKNKNEFTSKTSWKIKRYKKLLTKKART
jgi:DNA-directed RNA polymerase specialized sigma24 family protein